MADEELKHSEFGEDIPADTGQDVFAGNEAASLGSAAVNESSTQIPGTSKEEAKAALGELDRIMDENRQNPLVLEAIDRGRKFLEDLSDSA